MTIEKYDRSGGYKYVAYDNDGKILIITSSKTALKTACYSIKLSWFQHGSSYDDQANLGYSVPPETSLTHNKSVCISAPFRDMSLCRTMLPQNSTRSTFRDFELAAHMINASTTTSGAQKVPLTASFKINLSSVKSDTALLSWSFSFWSRFSSFNWSTPIPPYWLRQR